MKPLFPAPRAYRGVLQPYAVSFVLMLAAATAGAQAPVPSPAPKAPEPVAASPVQKEAEALSDALRAKRPAGGEHFGLYLMGKKVGHLHSDLKQDPKSKQRAIAETQLYFRANVGANVSERKHRETRVYEAKPGGKLLSFVFEQEGDGGAQRLEGKVTSKELRVIRKRPGQPAETLSLPLPEERIEDADPVRVALMRNQEVKGKTLDGQDLQHYGVTTTLGPSEERAVGGVKETLRTITTLSEKEKVPATVRMTDDGATVEIRFGEVLRASAEPKAVAESLDQVEVFGLTRVVLPKSLSPAARKVPGEVTLVVKGLEPRFQKNSARQKFQALPDQKTLVTLSASAPRKAAQFPLADPTGKGENLKSTLIVESNHPEVKAAAVSVVGGERDAYAAALKVNKWVFTTLEKSYGASADRASDVLRQKKGDCTEHSLLSVAMLRAVGIPARRVDGLVYMVNDDGVPALYWHEWVEAFVGEWTQLDPTFGQPVADATHIALGEEGNAEITLALGQLKVVEVR